MTIMRRMLLMLLFVVTGFVSVQAGDNDFLVFRTQDNTTTSVAALGTTITFAEGRLVATQGGQTVTIALGDMKDMYFASTSAVSLPSQWTAAGKAEVYTLSGQYVGAVETDANLAETLETGFYLVKKDGETRKIVVK